MLTQEPEEIVSEYLGIQDKDFTKSQKILINKIKRYGKEVASKALINFQKEHNLFGETTNL